MFELQDANFRTVAFGAQEYVNQYVKYQAPDGLYRIRGPLMEFYCVRRHGVVHPDPESALPIKHTNFQTLALQHIA